MMPEKLKEENILFIDIETVSQAQSYAELDERFKHLWAKKMEYLAKREEKTPEELYDNAAIWAEFGKVVCITAGHIVKSGSKRILRVKSFFGHNEKHLLENFAFLLNNHYNKERHFLCAHNGKEFDFAYLSRRMLINEIPLPKILDLAGKKPWEVRHLDTLELWKFGDFKHYTSLDLLAALFKIPSPKTEIDGSMVSGIYWNQGDLEKIASYCQNDVTTVCKILLKLMGEHGVNELHTEIVEPTITN